jgi:hypothetical protein
MTTTAPKITGKAWAPNIPWHNAVTLCKYEKLDPACTSPIEKWILAAIVPLTGHPESSPSCSCYDVIRS